MVQYNYVQKKSHVIGSFVKIDKRHLYLVDSGNSGSLLSVLHLTDQATNHICDAVNAGFPVLFWVLRLHHHVSSCSQEKG